MARQFDFPRVRAKTPARIPVVLARAEVRAILARTAGAPRLMLMMLYGTGLRLLECCRLRVKDVDFERNQIYVRRGKNDKDRVTMLPQAVSPGIACGFQPCFGTSPTTAVLQVGGLPDPPRRRRHYADLSNAEIHGPAS